MTGVSAIAAGTSSSFALKTDGLSSGRVWGWGYNATGQLGDGSSAPRHSIPVSGPAAVASLAAGDLHTHAITIRGQVLAFGDNGSGRLGDGDHHRRLAPVYVVGLGELLALDGGAEHTLAVRADGRVWAWGAHALDPPGNPLRPIEAPGLVLVPDNDWLLGDPDADGLVTIAEYRLGTDPLSADSNGDGVTDGIAMSTGLDATSPDVDGDGLSNVEERVRGTDPFRADTDGDGVVDGADAFPFDPNRSQMPPPDPDDTTPPVITLIEPRTAVPTP